MCQNSHPPSDSWVNASLEGLPIAPLRVRPHGREDLGGQTLSLDAPKVLTRSLFLMGSPTPTSTLNTLLQLRIITLVSVGFCCLLRAIDPSQLGVIILADGRVTSEPYCGTSEWGSPRMRDGSL